MEEQLINFETAILAKNKGFLLNTPKTYNDGGVLCIQSNYPHYIDEEDISAPTQSLLQKWLKDEHNIIVEVFMHKTTKTTYHFRNNIIFANDRFDIDYTNYLETYEECLEEGLFLGLKQINYDNINRTSE